VVAAPGRRRFEISGARIRALHGHSVAVDVDHEAATPPMTLFHGTTAAKMASIGKRGLERGRRRHVHLTESRAEALQIGGRRGVPVVIEVRARDLHRDRAVAFLRVPRSSIWLVDAVPAAYLRIPRRAE
jgi:putative RNA 2'-phosphotransferase